MSRNWTDEQLCAIDARGGSILVSAAAGSGKTSVLVERVLRLITDETNPIPADRLVIVTFTNAAAAEMKQRLNSEIMRRMEADPDNRLLQEQQILLGAASICTIHSFCFDLIRQNFHVLDISAGFRISDETEMKTLSSKAMEQTLNSLYSEQSDEMNTLVDFFCTKGDAELINHIEKLYRFTRSIPFPDNWLDAQLAFYSNPSLEENKWVNDIFNVTQDILSDAYDVNSDMHTMLNPTNEDKATIAALETLDNDLLIMQKLQSLVKLKAWDDMRKELNQIKFTAFRTSKLTTDIEMLKQKRESVKSLITKDLSRLFICSKTEYIEDMKLLAKILTKLFNAVKIYSNTLIQIKKENNVLEFADAMHYALKLLTKNEDGKNVQSELAKELSSYYEYIIIDEFQDVTTVADEVFNLISRNGENLFIVGDVKQSIYRFNQANPDLFISKKEEASDFNVNDPQHISRVFLTRNFRSRPEVTKFVNFIFEKIMSKKAGEIDYDSGELLKAAATYPEAEDRDVELCVIDTKLVNDNSDDEDDDKLTLEAKFVAQKIYNMIKSGYQVADGNGGMRACTYRDFCILMRSPSNRAGVYMEQLKDLGIDVASKEGRGYFSSREMMIMLNLLRIIDNPLRDISLASVMLSPMFSFNAQELAQIRIRNRSAALYIAVVEYTGDELGEKCKRLIEALQMLREYAANYSIVRLISKVYDSADFLSVMQALDSGEQKSANLRLLLEYAAAFERSGGGGISGFLRYIDRVMESSDDVSQANVISDTDNVVRIMSIHKSKGLEFPICFVCSCSSRFNLMDLNAELLLHYDKGVGVKINERRKLKKYTTLPYEAIRYAIQSNTISEEMRLLYVALTRAKEKLIITLSEANLDSKLSKLSTLIADDCKISPYSALSARSFGDWLLLCALSHSSGEHLRARIEYSPKIIIDDNFLNVEVISKFNFSQKESELQITYDSKPDINDVKRIQQALSFSYEDQELTRLPAKLTVT
ncbi:MAG TPA: helicase-exonuclease AddAB subunit AddA, partial [Oscillospiraceae bacterium]|nr:helicase-exonuclease AddAB subunit AddA [Oscillospiraceae bacterium]